jgi:hypothetical protein
MKIDVPGNCRNPNYTEYTDKDELFIKGKVKTGTLVSMVEFIAHSRNTFPDYDQPFMVIHGGKDKLVDPQVAFDLYR